MEEASQVKQETTTASMSTQQQQLFSDLVSDSAPKNAFDLLVELSVRERDNMQAAAAAAAATTSPNQNSDENSHSVLKDLISKKPLHQIDVPTTADKKKKPSPKRPRKKPNKKVEAETAEISQMQFAMANEHNYFAKPPPSSEPTIPEELRLPSVVPDDYESDRTDSASEAAEYDAQLEIISAQIAIEHNYSLVPPDPILTAKSEPQTETTPTRATKTVTFSPDTYKVSSKSDKKLQKDENHLPTIPETQPLPKEKKRKKSNKDKLKDITDIVRSEDNREIKSHRTPPVRKPPQKLQPRHLQEERQIAYDILVKGIDDEDIKYLKRRYEELIGEDNAMFYWLNDTHWVEHSLTCIPDPAPPKKKRRLEEIKTHKTGRMLYILSDNEMIFISI